MPPATTVGMHNSRRGRNRKQRRNKSRGVIKSTYCQLCLFEGEDSVEFDLHINEPRHIYNYLLHQFKEHRTRKSKDRHGVKIEMSCNGNKLCNTKDGTVKTIVDPKTEEVVYEFIVKNTGERRQTPMVLKNILLLHPFEAFSVHDEQNVSRETCQVRLPPGNGYLVSVKFRNDGIGSYGVPVCFVLDREDIPAKDRPFFIVRLMVINVKEPEEKTEEEENMKESPFTGERWLGMEEIYEGRMPDGRRIHRFEKFAIPLDLIELLEHNLVPYPEIDDYLSVRLSELLNLLNDAFPQDPSTYAELFHTMLYIEEYKETQQVERYNMADVPITVINDSRIQFEVPGLAEKRPSVLKGDLIYLRVSLGKDEVERRQYEGVVCEVKDTVVWIGGFHESLMERLRETPTLRFDVHFSINRFTMYVMHRALDIFVKEDFSELIFPSLSQYPPLPLTSNIEFINPKIENNSEQAKAVTNIVLGTSRPAPYIIHGPPGTGKTMTLVEAILQVKKVIRNSYILVCAPANSACDLLAQKLIPHCTTKELLRLHSSSRDWETVPADLHPYSNRDKDLYSFPNEKEILGFRIIVCTLINSGRLLPKKKDDDFADFSHFTHVFIDESGQALEPATLVPVAGILRTAKKNFAGGQLILAGDPLQLGPVCASKYVGVSILSESLMERLMKNCDLYGREENDGECYNNKYITKLCWNFRTHDLILRLPNENFYDGELVSKCGLDVTNDTVKNLTKDEELNLPIVFHGVLGQEKREGRSPSFFNVFEIQVVMEYVTKLMEGGLNRDEVQQNDIGIIAPYIRQVYKLKTRLKEKNWDKIEVGTTETFQGREKRVIIISTVRSNRNLLDFDGKYNLGFVRDEKRFNVAITRARSLLIVVGNPYLLEGDKYWNELIRFTIGLGSYRGCPYSSRLDPAWVNYVKDKLSMIGI